MHHAKMPCLNKDERNRAETMLLAGTTQQEVATGIGVHQSTVQRSKGRLHQFGNTDDRPRPGHPRVTIPRQDGQIRLEHLRNRFKSAVETVPTIAGRGNQYFYLSAYCLLKTQR